MSTKSIASITDNQYQMKATRTQVKENANRSASTGSYRWDAYSDVNHTMPGENFKPAAAQYEAIIASMRAEISQLKKQQSQRLLYITNASSEGIWEWNIGTGHIYRNMTLQSMIGFAVENTQDLSWWFERVHPEDKKQIEAQINSVLNLKRQSWELEYRFRCADNTYKAVYDRGFIIYENNQPIRMIGTLQDLTEVKELEGRLSQERM
ncbi:MAG: PAS domain-containing protein, partial [Bacteroidetes bacterium]|nr:PAS domain-containing protein [Bacteroidota bacterium]